MRRQLNTCFSRPAALVTGLLLAVGFESVVGSLLLQHSFDAGRVDGRAVAGLVKTGRQVPAIEFRFVGFSLLRFRQDQVRPCEVLRPDGRRASSDARVLSSSAAEKKTSIAFAVVAVSTTSWRAN